MKIALFFLACISVTAAQFWHPLAPCNDHHQCPAGYCCRYSTVVLFQLCELRPNLDWPCDPTFASSCECNDGLTCQQDPATAQFTCQLEMEVPA
uniref:Dickkopf related protein-3 n=1 Tax=Branchiostoma belcheri tsingtauense TaxID=155462 RepID=Q6J0U3_BRABE|nr:dickkopf related protein-3 precursor [Branchiostoma belcheri tsingtauense]